MTKEKFEELQEIQNTIYSLQHNVQKLKSLFPDSKTFEMYAISFTTVDDKEYDPGMCNKSFTIDMLDNFPALKDFSIKMYQSLIELCNSEIERLEKRFSDL